MCLVDHGYYTCIFQFVQFCLHICPFYLHFFSRLSMFCTISSQACPFKASPRFHDVSHTSSTLFHPLSHSFQGFFVPDVLMFVTTSSHHHPTIIQAFSPSFPGACAPLPELQQALELSGGDADRAEAVVKLKAELGALGPMEKESFQWMVSG